MATRRALLLTGWLLALTLWPAPAQAQWATPLMVSVKVGESRQVEVGAARGLRCDDLSIVRAELREHTETNNLLVLTGLRVGRTSCRVGVYKGMPSVFATVVVTR